MPRLNDTLWQDIRYAARLLKNSPGFAAIAILSLALGIGANTAIFSIMDAVMLKYLPVRDPGQLYQITTASGNTEFTNPIWEQVRDRQDVFSGVFAWSPTRFNVANGGEAKDVQGLYASGGFFSTLGVNAIVGRTFVANDDRGGCPGVAVISYGFWQQRYGGDAGAIGKTISLDGHLFPIVGVTPPGFFGVDVGRFFDVAIPVCSQPLIQGESALIRRGRWWLQIIGRLKPGVTAQQTAARMRVLAPQVYDATTPQNWQSKFQQEYRNTGLAIRAAASGISNLRSQYRNALFLLMVVVALVLLIACANIANLTLARASARQREIAVRLAVGASRGRLIRQLLTESLLLSLAGAALGILFAIWGAHLLVRYLSSTHNVVDLPLGIDLRMLGFTAAVAVFTGLLFGLAPAFRGTHLSPNLALKESSRGATEGRSKFRLGRLLVIAQVSLSLVLLIGAGLFVRSFYNLATLDAGFVRDHVLLVTVDIRNGKYPQERRAALYEELLEHMRAIPGVRSASEAFLTPISHEMWNQELHVDGYVAKSRTDTLVWFNAVSPQYLETMGTPLLAGRDFNSHDMLTNPKVAIVNETMAHKFFHNRNPLGQSYRQDGKPVSIVGVMKDAKYGTLRENTLPTAFVPASQWEKPRTSITYQLRTAAAPLTLKPFVTEAAAGINKNISLEFNTLATQVDDSLIQERLVALLSGFFGALALLLATVGLYGVMSYMVARRRNEIGIRMALGAERRSVLALILREVALLIGAGVIAGGAAAFATTRLVTKMLFGLKPNDATTMLLAAAILIAVAAIAGYLPARRAASLDPMAALREE